MSKGGAGAPGVTTRPMYGQKAPSPTPKTIGPAFRPQDAGTVPAPKAFVAAPPPQVARTFGPVFRPQDYGTVPTPKSFVPTPPPQVARPASFLDKNMDAAMGGWEGYDE